MNMSMLRSVNLLLYHLKGSHQKLLVIESEEESPDGDSDEDPTENMDMLSNKLEYLAR
jgi:hypothetical protein